ncbi:MAG: conjugal transfer protein TraX [Clostridia bacterium]|nr:conjugal transfer protein TraX [Clostridia bacterium]
MKKSLTSFDLRVIALAAMFLDHVGAIVYLPYLETLPQVGFAEAIFYYALRAVGRIAFPLYCYLLVRGFVHTRSRVRYAVRLFVFALLSELPFDLAVSGRVFVLGDSNVFFTLLFGLLAMIGISRAGQLVRRRYERGGRRGLCALAFAAMLAVICAVTGLCAWRMGSDYGLFGVAAIVIMYLLRRYPVFSYAAGAMALIRFGILSLPVFSLAALPLVYFYGGERGRSVKYFFYAFYPVHLLLLALLARVIL